jgi:hypothetical protein
LTEIVGLAPELARLLCQAAICQGFVYRGELVQNAGVVHLCFDGIWHRLIIDCGVIIWRESKGPPAPANIASEGFEYPLVDAGALAGIIGHRLDGYTMATTGAGGRVVFRFDNGRTITINNENDLTAFHID